MNRTYDADEIMEIIIRVRTIQDLLAMLNQCYFSDSSPECFHDWTMSVLNATEPLIPGIIEFLERVLINGPDCTGETDGPEREEKE